MNLGHSQPKRPMGCRTKIFWKSFQLRSNAGRNRFIALLCTSNWFFGPKREKTGLVHFPLGFRGKNFEIFFRPKIISKDTLGIGSSRTKTADRYMHPSGTQGVLKKICQNSEITRKWEKWVIVPGGCTYLGWGAGQTKLHIIPPHPINIGF